MVKITRPDPREVAAAAEIAARTGMAPSRYGAGTKWMWGVYVGSHGGQGKTLVKAMRACLQCCGLGEWWAVNPPDDTQLLKEFFAEVAVRHGLGTLYRNK